MGSIPLRQVLNPDRVDLYRSNRCVGGFSYTAIQGFVHHRRDTWQATPQELWALVRPDHPGIDNAPTQMPSDSFWVIDFELDDDSLALMSPSTADEERGITPERFAEPWLGTGVAASTGDALVREYILLSPLEMLPGAVISEVDSNGALSPVASLSIVGTGERRWIDMDGNSIASPDQSSALHRLFVNTGGWTPAAALGPEHVLILGSDERTVRLRTALPGVVGPSGILMSGGSPDAGWAIVQGSHVRRLWMTTMANFGGLPVTVVYATPTPQGTIAGVTWVGRPYPTMAQHGFWGDQYSGFHAEVPWDILTDFRDVPVEIPIVSDAQIEASPDPVTSAGTSLWASEYLMVDSGYITAVVDVDSTMALVPDFRSANIMYPGNGGISRIDRRHTLVDLAPLNPRRVEVATSGHLIDGENVVVVGSNDHDLLISDGPDSPLRSLARESVMDLSDRIIPRT
ncbi:hypothetical protein [Schaalia vaccimaxillae]|uniref:hypothetical protein n=1 Tax=Schaalia vaccimaxillae TaxID=183916 RepID=UPI0003FE97A3|nr:hypothetical protein [Schaalia vaccimaxillae]